MHVYVSTGERKFRGKHFKIMPGGKTASSYGEERCCSSFLTNLSRFNFYRGCTHDVI